MEARSQESQFRHALRNAMHTILLCLAVLECETDPAERLTWLEQIEGAADTAIGLLDHSPHGLEPTPTGESSGGG